MRVRILIRQLPESPAKFLDLYTATGGILDTFDQRPRLPWTLLCRSAQASLDPQAPMAHNNVWLCAHRLGRPMDVEAIISGLKDLDRVQLARLETALKRRLREFGADGGGQPVSGVVEYRPYADGTLQAEVRYHVRKDGTATEQGPYWYFRYHESGRQKKLYLGKTDDPEGELARKRAAGHGAA